MAPKDNLRAFLGKKSSVRYELLWGTLHVKILRCTKLRNMDRVPGLLSLGTITDKSDPYITVWIEGKRLYKTRTIHDDLNPVFNEEFIAPVGQKTYGIRFLAQDFDEITSDDFLGEYTLPVMELLSEDVQGNQRRVGIHRNVFLDGKRRHGSLEFFIEFIPARMSPRTLAVPGAYFPETTGNDPKFYMNADDDGSSPEVRYEDDKVFKPPRLWRDIYDAICGARHFVYVAGWSVDVDQYLLRGRELDDALAGRGYSWNGKYSPRIGDLLKAKADEGVIVNALIWDDATSGVLFPGQMGTHDEKSRGFFSRTGVAARFVATVGGDVNNLIQGTTKTVLFTHHQKFVVCDSPRKGGGGGRELLAFIGGIDLTEGRWDNQKHPLFRSLQSDHKGDTYNGCFNVGKAGPREPWHDIHSMVRGPGALQIVQNFHERWKKQCPDLVSRLADMESFGFTPETLANEGGWHCQLSRSIDARICIFDKATLQDFKSKSVDEMAAGKWERESVRRDKIQSSRRFQTATNSHLEYNRTLQQKKGRDVDRSIELANIHHIRRAQHFIYIESQYFQGSSHMWLDEDDRKVKCGNLIASEITLKICDKIAKGERFAAYILVPMWCEGITSSPQVQEIVYWEKSTIEAMHAEIQNALEEARSDYKVSDFLNFYCLGTRETPKGSEAPAAPSTSDEKLLAQTRRHQIYIHSKFMVVDDEVALIGTANVNERSMDGSRDAEIMMTYWHPDQLADNNSVARGDIHGYRLHIWASITNEMDNVFRNPWTHMCVRKMNKIAQRNWLQYLGNRVVDMKSHLLPAPWEWFPDHGELRARRELTDGRFPDTKGKVVGKKSFLLPDYVTS